MANFEKLAGKKSTRANMNEQIQNLGLDEKPKPKMRKEDPEKDVNKPGSKAYLERRQRESDADFKQLDEARKRK